MLRGLYSAASGMFTMERKQEALSDNLANAQSPGYKKDETVLRAFPNLLIQRIRDFDQAGNGSVSGVPQLPQSMTMGELSNGVYAQERIPSFEQGTLVQTDGTFDVAIDDQAIPAQEVNGRDTKPAAFFAVQLPDGTVGYTRNGKWDLDGNGNLVTSEGYRVLGANGEPIQVTSSIRREDLQIDGNGRLLANGNETIGQIGVAIAENPLELSRLGGNVYQAENPLAFMQEENNPGVSLQQGFLEQSNVDSAKTMTDMMMAIRSYEANQKVISVYDTSLDQLNSVGRMNG